MSIPLPPQISSIPDASILLDTAVARRAVKTIFRYDLMRVQTYAQRPGNPNRIAVREFGSATAMRFPEVGYFNQVCQLRERDLAHLPHIVRFYRECGLGMKINVAVDTRRSVVFHELARAGFRVSEMLARMVRPIGSECPDMSAPQCIAISGVESDERELFFNMYLDAFGADPAKRRGALDNMTLLHDVPDLRMRFARNGDVPVGLCMVHLQKRTALLCAGATEPGWRRVGIQRALIDLRLRMGREAGCDLAVSWTDAGSQSFDNLKAGGFETAVIDPVWSLQPGDPCRL